MAESEGRYTEQFRTEGTPLAGDIDFRPVPYSPDSESVRGAPVWRIRFILASDPTREFALEINGEVTLGRSAGRREQPDLIDLNPFGAAEKGVSRHHLLLRPTTTNLFIIDLGSTNGTLRNGRSIGVNTPYSLVDGDTIALGQLRFVVRIADRPSLATLPPEQKVDLADALIEIAKAITSQLDLESVLNQVAEMAQALTEAGEVGIWLVDENSGELRLEAARGIEDEEILQMRMTVDDSLIGEVIRSAQPMRASRAPGESEIKVKTGYLVEALAYVPLALGGVTFGVLAATHRVVGRKFSRRDERLLEAIADFAAIAIQNARLYHVTDEALQRRVQELAALNQLAYTVSSSLDLNRVYEVLVEQINRQWPVEAVRLYLLDEQGQKLLRHRPGAGEKPFPIDAGIVGRVARTARMVVTANAAHHPDYEPSVDNLDGTVPNSLACLPLVIKNRVVGVLALFNKADGAFTEEDIQRLRAFTSPVATAIENARLFAESERRRAAIQATAETLPQPLIILDEDGNLLVANDRAMDILETNMSALFEGVSSGVGQTTEVEIGEETYLTTTEHVKDVGTIVVMQDITEVKRLEAARSEFLHMLSHDMKSPLSSVLGYAQLLGKTLPMEERHRNFLLHIQNAANRMLEMINQLLQTVDEDATVQHEGEEMALDALVDQVLQDLAGAATGKSIALNHEMEGEPFPIRADRTRLYHALLNLVENAVKYSPPETEVDVFLSYGEEEITVQVKDQGPGVQKEDLPRIFDKYYRGRQPTGQPGSGLGLAVVRANVEIHGGQVSVENRSDGGAVFTVTLPAGLRYSPDGTSSEAEEAPAVETVSADGEPSGEMSEQESGEESSADQA